MSTPDRVILHVGLPKSGTSAIQGTTRHWAGLLREHGVPTYDEVSFEVGLDLRENAASWGRDPRAVAGSWDRVADRMRADTGTRLLSQELLSGVSAEGVERVARSLTGMEVHVVATVRDPARQLVADWQEWVKHGLRDTFAEWSSASLDESGGPVASAYRSTQDLEDVLGRWSVLTAPERVHVVTLPPSGGPRGELWQRFADAVGIDTEIVPLVGGTANASLGVTEIAVLRRVNAALDGRLPREQYGPTVKWFYSQEILSRFGSRRPSLPAELQGRTEEMADRWVRAVTSAGYRVHGDLEDLRPPPAGAGSPDDVETDDVLDAAIRGTADLLMEVNRARARVVELREENRELRAAVEKQPDG